MDFYLDGVHCAACVWLTEKVANFVEGVSSIRLNLGSSVAHVQISEKGKFSEAADALEKMGYRPHPVKQGAHEVLQKKENRLFLIRIAVAAACAGNIMLLAVSLYSGADGAFAERFKWISFGLFLPVLLFSATPFYRSAWGALRSKEISIDIPVVFGLLLGSAVSIANLFNGDDRVYFDSLSTLVLLLLSTRFALKRTQQIAADSSRALHFLTPSRVKRWNATREAYDTIRVDELVQGDRVRVLPSESIPADGVILTGDSSLDCSLLTGESRPHRVTSTDLVFAGTTNLDSPIEIQVTQSGTQSRIGKILTSMESMLSRKAKITIFAHRVARYFVGAVLFLFGLSFFISPHGTWTEGLNRALAISIVTCPCTFALITPLAFSMTLGRLARMGVLVKGPEVLERLAQIQTVFLDKTGTLTFGSPQVVQWKVPADLETAILALESLSTHPIALALVQYLRPRVKTSVPTPTDIKETQGQGIQGRIGSDLIEIRRALQTTLGTELEVLKNNQSVGRIVLNDQIRPESKSMVEKLRSIELTPWILSGDHTIPVQQTARIVGIKAGNCIAQASPEMKSEWVRSQNPALMIGDGANDALALAQASVGIAVRSGVEISLQASDIYLRTPGVRPIYEIVVIARETLWVVKRNLLFSTFYNLVAGGFALFGKIDPLLAAVLMPVSALMVLTSTFTGTRRLRSAFQELKA